MDDDAHAIVKPPSPQLLALHATCAQVAHLSGAAEHLYDIFSDHDVDRMAPTSDLTQPEANTVLIRKLKALTIIPPAAKEFVG